MTLGLGDPGVAGDIARRGRRVTPFVGTLVAITAALLMIDLAVKTYDRYVERVPLIKGIFNVGSEGNLATWWNTVLLLVPAGLAIAAAALTPAGARVRKRAWLSLAAVASLMSLDEAVELHERLGAPAGAWSRAHEVHLPTYAWVLPGSVLAVVGMIIAWRWARSLPSDLRLGLMAALAVYFSGAVIMEAVNGWFKKADASASYLLGTMVEEALEMGGCLIAVAVIANVFVLDRADGRLSLRLREDL